MMFLKTFCLLYFLVLGVCGFFSKAESADFFAIFLCDTFAENIQLPVKKDLYAMRQEAKRIAGYTNLNLKELILEGGDLFPKFVFKNIKQLSFQPEDIVFFYFSGHGYRTASKGSVPWPNLFFTAARRGVDFDEICTILQKKKPQLLLAVADCCNNYRRDVIQERQEKGRFLKSMLIANYRNLFLYTKGVIKIASSKPGEHSWAVKTGSVYTNAFLKNLEYETVQFQKASWASLLDRTALDVCHYQTPIADLALE